MSFLTEYFDHFRAYPIRKTPLCRPEDSSLRIEGKWLDPRKGKEDRPMTDEEIEAFIKKTMKSLRGQSTYFNTYCAHHDQDLKTRPFEPRPRKNKCKPDSKDQKEEVETPAPALQKLALKDTVVMKMAKELYEKDLTEPTLEPLQTHFKLFGYTRPQLFHIGISEYQDSYSRAAYEMVRDDRVPRYVQSNGGRPKWGYPPEAERQPMLDGLPFDGERLYE